MHTTSTVLSDAGNFPSRSLSCTSAVNKHEGRFLSCLLLLCPFAQSDQGGLYGLRAYQHDLSLLADIAFCMLNRVSITAAASFEWRMTASVSSELKTGPLPFSNPKESNTY